MNAVLTERDLSQSIAEKYRTNGYVVEIEPHPSRVPFDLNGYRPDMIAIKDDAKLIIEVKLTSQKFSLERLQAIAQLVSQHQGWRFIIVTADDVENDYLPDNLDSYPSWHELSTQAKQIPLIIDAIGHPAALIYIWGLLEAIFRRYAIDASIPIERLPFTRIAKHFYSIGELSIEELDLLLTIQIKRNKAAHGCSVDITRTDLNQLIDFINSALSNWGKEQI